MMIQHCVWPANHPSFDGLRAKVRMFAYIVGFIEMIDICNLEQIARTKKSSSR